MLHKKCLYSATLLLLATTSCQTGNNTSDQQATLNKPDCACTTADAERLAFRITSEFRKTQDQLESGMARIMNVDNVEKRDNCTWVATFKISWPFGNTDGAHPDELITRRIGCDGREVYVQ